MTACCNDIARDAVASVLHPGDYSRLDAEELSSLGTLGVELFMTSAFGHRRLSDDYGFRLSLHGIAEALCSRCEMSSSPQELSFLVPALFNLTRTGLFGYDDDRARFDRKLVDMAMSSTSSSFPALHAALMSLMQEPLTRLEFDSRMPGMRRYRFTVGGDLYTSTLRSWASGLHDDGSRDGVGIDEALSRIRIFESDFGSLDGVDNLAISHLAYGYYSCRDCATPQTLRLKYQSCVCRWGYAPVEDDMLPFVRQASSMLSRAGVPAAHRHQLQYVLLSAAGTMMDLGL